MISDPSLCRVNDWLLKINDVDLTNKDRKQVIKAVLSWEGVINMVVRRRKSLGGRVITPIQINLAGHKGQFLGAVKQSPKVIESFLKCFDEVFISPVLFQIYFMLKPQSVLYNRSIPSNARVVLKNRLVVQIVIITAVDKENKYYCAAGCVNLFRKTPIKPIKLSDYNVTKF